MFDVVVVGAGIFGSIIAEAFRVKGRLVASVDDARPFSGSTPAACLMRPSWFSSLGKDVYAPSLSLLDELYGVSDLKFKTAVGQVVVHWCDPKKILKKSNYAATVKEIVPTVGGWVVCCADGLQLVTKVVVIAAGIWSVTLVRILGGLIGQTGLACLWPDEFLEEPFIRGWAPYKQITAFNRGDGLWVGDSNNTRQDRWSEKQASATLHRCSQAVGLMQPSKRLVGVRPYTKQRPCYLKEEREGLWVATGGAKNGTVAAGWCASELLLRAL